MELDRAVTHFAVTRFEAERAVSNKEYCNTVWSLAPDDMSIPLLFLSIRIHPHANTIPEINECAKIFYILSGEGEMLIDGQRAALRAGETLWLPKGSEHVIKTDDQELRLLVLK